MSYQINYLQEEDYLIAEVKGSRKRSTEAQYALEALAKISESCKKHNISKVVTVWDIKGAISPDQALILISNLKKYKWSKDFVTASVHPNKENFDSHQYTVKVAKTLKWNIHFFQNVEDAKDWIRKIDCSS